MHEFASAVALSGAALVPTDPWTTEAEVVSASGGGGCPELPFAEIQLPLEGLAPWSQIHDRQ